LNASPACAVVILNWNGLTHLQQFLPSVINNTPASQAELVLIDNASTDESVAWLRQHHPQVRIVENSRNHGFAGGYNEGLKGLSHDYFVLLNSDVEVTENWLLPLLESLQQNQVAAVQPRVLSFKEKDNFEHAGAAGGYIDRLGFPFCRGRLFSSIESDHQQYSNEAEIFWASGACFAIKSKLFFEAAGFDEDFFAHMEEIDLCWRLKNSGYRILYNGHSVVYHLGGGTLSAISPRKTFLNFRNNLFMLIKNLPSKYLKRVIFVRLCLDGLAGIYFFLKGQPRHCFAIIEAHFAFYKLAGRMHRKRKNSTNQQIKLQGVYLRSLVWDYYVRGRKKFSDLPQRLFV
jgi:GT2 family glycosyltransferase